MSQTRQRISRYAKALLDVADLTGTRPAVSGDMATVSRWLADSEAFGLFAACARLGDKTERLMALRELSAAAGLGAAVTEFLQQMEASQHLEHLGEIVAEFERQRKEREGIVPAEVVSARPLTEEQRVKLARRLGEGRRLEMTYRVDASLRGGFVARVGEQVHDCSLAGRLARLRRRLRAV